jgi:hypothetical protein
MMSYGKKQMLREGTHSLLLHAGNMQRLPSFI